MGRRGDIRAGIGAAGPPGGAPGARPRRSPAAVRRRAGERAPTSPLYRFTGADGARGVVSGAARR